MSLSLALRAVPTDLLQVSGVVPKLRRFAQLSSILFEELTGTLRFVRYGVRALGLHRDLALFAPVAAPVTPSVTLYDTPYGLKPRNLLDIYHPLDTDPQSVVLFVHGGVWCSGEKWQYAPLAKSLSMDGVAVCVMSYTLFPDASAQEISQEVNLALDHVLNRFSSTTHVTLVGHSAGAQTSMMATLERAQQGKRMPDSVVAMCGVYDVATHFEYERRRGVHELSAMKRAMGGHEHFAEQSPTCILSSLPLSSPPQSLSHYTVALDEGRALVERLPKMTLMTSTVDTTVPSSQSVALYRVLKGLGGDCGLLEYPDVPHSHFATMAWTAQLYGSEATAHPRFVSEFMALVKGMP